MADNNIERNEGKQDDSSSFGDIISAVAFMILAVLMFIGAVDFPWHLNHETFLTAPGFTPLLLSTLIVVLSVILIVTTVRREGKKNVRFRKWFQRLKADESFKRLGIVVVIAGVYIFLVGVLNFIFLTWLFLLGTYSYLRIGKIPRILIYSVMNAIIIAYLVPKLFQLPLPS